MERLIRKYLDKLESQGLAKKENAVFLARDAELVSSRPLRGDTLQLSKVFDLMNINSVLFAEPAEPYKSIVQEIIRSSANDEDPRRIVPLDCEMRTFFHDIPIVEEFSPETIAKALSHRKAAIIKDRGIVTYGVVTPEQAFVSFSSACFSSFVKYFYDRLISLQQGASAKTIPGKDGINAFERIASYTSAFVPDLSPFSLMEGPAGDEDAIIKMISEAGRAVVTCRLVDSFFGNISYVSDNFLYISQTGSSLDELESCIDAVPLDGSSSVGITASSELSAHKQIYYKTGDHAILHGHPRFSVVMSMHCLKDTCDRDMCHTSCKERREISGIPIVSGEIGRGSSGLMHTVPSAMKEGNGVLVYGHGVFTSGKGDFRKPFQRLLDIETKCREEYFRLIEHR
ncbi:MAG: class II aldolase/adducin family protein [Thermodesulfovibrionales bacterium]|jgi:ribulose-5-phosphate 4-epimerase/fuculose-1-phosphate aldolase